MKNEGSPTSRHPSLLRLTFSGLKLLRMCVKMVPIRDNASHRNNAALFCALYTRRRQIPIVLLFTIKEGYTGEQALPTRVFIQRAEEIKITS